jgi:amino acid permease
MRGSQDEASARKGRVVALVIAISMLLWLGAQWAGPALGLAGRYALLIDFAAIGALVWALVVSVQIWRARQSNERH